MRKFKFLKWTLILLLVLGVGGAGAIWLKAENVLDKIIVQSEPDIQKDQSVVHGKSDPISIAILGKDTRGNIGLLNTDVIIVAVLNPETKHVSMVSIPRDTGVLIPGYKGWYKINSVYARGEEQRREDERRGKPVEETGISLVKETLQQAVGIPIQYYVTVDFEGFEKVIDKLGGISVNVDKTMKYDDPADGTHIDLQAGEQILNGEQALGFVRHRKDNRGEKYYSSDFDRGKRQQVVIKAVVDKMKSFSGLAAFLGIMEVAGEHIRTDVPKDQLKEVFLNFKSIGSENITSIFSGGYWDPISTQTIIPKQNVLEIQHSLRNEMGLELKNVSSSFREQPSNQVNAVPKRTVQEEEALKVQLEEKKNEQVNMERAQHVAPQPVPKAPSTPKSKTNGTPNNSSPNNGIQNITPNNGASNSAPEISPPVINPKQSSTDLKKVDQK